MGFGYKKKLQLSQRLKKVVKLNQNWFIKTKPNQP